MFVIIMLAELDKYRVEIFKIAGFACMAPLGRIFFEPLALLKECGLILFLGYMVTALALTMLGLIFISKGYDILDAEKRK